MIGIDFRDRGVVDEFHAAFTRALERARSLRAELLVIGVLLAFVGIESVRLGVALHNVRELERRRDVLAAEVQTMQAHVRAVRDRRTVLLTALARRRSNLDLAQKIATASDLLATSMALTQLRAAPDGFDIEGIGTSLTDIRASLGRLEMAFSKPATFELRRDDVVQSALSFHVDIANK